MTSELLRGREHHVLAEIEVRATGDGAIALSLGGAPKVYSHTDPNEDVALLVSGEHGVVVAVADGHGGVDAAEIAIAEVAAAAERWTTSEAAITDWRGEALALLVRANASIRGQATLGGRRLSRTTLVFALVRRGEPSIQFSCIGDSHVFHATPEGVLDLARDRAHASGQRGDGTCFLGYADETPETLAAKAVIDDEPLPRTRAVVLVTDGLSERGVGVDEPEEAVNEAVVAACAAEGAAPAEALVLGVVERALAAHRRRRSGDNVAVAAVWLDDGSGDGGSER